MVVVAVTLDRLPTVLPLGNLALDGDHSPLHQVGLLTTPTPRLVPRFCLPAQFLLDLCSFHFPFSIFSLFPAILSQHPFYVYLCPFCWLCAQAPGRKAALPAKAAPSFLLSFSCTL